MKQQTAMQELFSEIESKDKTLTDAFEWIVKNKKMLLKKERQQIIDAVEYGNYKGYDEHTRTSIHDLDELYYETTYGGEK